MNGNEDADPGFETGASTEGPGTETAATEAAGAPGGESPPKKRRVLRILAVLLCLLLLLVALLPTIISSGPVTAMIVDAAREGSGRWIGLDLDAGWGVTHLGRVKVCTGPEEGSLVLFQAESVRGLPGVAGLLGGSLDAPDLVLDRPTIVVDLRPAPPDAGGKTGGKTDDKGAGAAGGGGDPLPPFAVKVTIKDGALVVMTEDGERRDPVRFSGTISASRDAPADVDLVLTSPTVGTVKIVGTVTALRGGRPATDTLEAAVALTLEALRLDEAAPFLAGTGIEQLAGTVDGAADIAWSAGGLDAGKVSLVVKDLVVAGPAVGEGRRIAEPAVGIDATVRAPADGTLEAAGIDLRLAGLRVTGDLARPAGGGWNGALDLKGAVAPWIDRVKRWGIESRGAAQGEFEGQVRATGDTEAQRWNVHLSGKDMQFSPGRGGKAVDEPSPSLNLDIVQKGETWRIDAASVKSDTVRASASGEVTTGGDARLQVTASVFLKRSTEILAAFGAGIPGSVTGRADIETFLERTGETGRAEGTLTLSDLRVIAEGGTAPALAEDRLTVVYAAAPAGDRWNLSKLDVKGNLATVTGSGSVATDGGDASLDLDIRAKLQPLLETARAFGTEIPVEAAAEITWTGKVGTSEKGEAWSASGTATATDLAVTLPAEEGAEARTVTEKEIVVDVDASGSGGAVDVKTLHLRGGGADLTGTLKRDRDGVMDGRVKGRAAMGPLFARLVEFGIATKDPGAAGALVLDATFSGTAESPAVRIEQAFTEGFAVDLKAGGTWSSGGASDLTLDVGGSIDAILGLLHDGGWMEEGADGASGRLALRGTAKATGPDAPLNLDMALTTEQLRLASPDGKHAWTPKELALSLNGVWTPKVSTFQGKAGMRTGDGRLDVEGTLDLREGRRQLVSKADLDIDLSGLVKARPDLVPMENVAPGRAKGTVTLRGPLGDPPDWAKLGGSLRLSLDSLETEPFTAKDMTVDLLVEDGVLRTRNVSATVNGGAVTATAVMGFSGDAPAHHLEVSAREVQVDRALTQLLEKVVPIFSVGDSGSMSGKLTTGLVLDATGPDWKEAKRTMEGKGSLAVVDGVVRGSGILGEIMGLLGGGGDLQFKSATTEFRVSERRVWNDKLLVDGDELPMVLVGSTDFMGRLDYKISATALGLDKKQQKRIAKFLADDGTLPFGLKGTLDKPKLKKPDIGKVAGDTIKDKLKDLFD